ncbi:beta-ketoacyl-[acyl-carrier-protein] synthase family protein [Marixanthomonas spongiae]|uniref:Beta-ketoacyl synthase n=1 Tax=Marixanthomonas spongiae TaxID=2174845 RepID=A0A2U0I001_9FLAO|nr:beta-ketoacyl synthase N-terminal-like domain-containing protein [Marixanthomonas spongiae]PVW14310.1 beta-ketoacyl synthase [Marixanthomonas spongiae]
MSKPVYIQEASLVTPLGFSIAANILALENEKSGIEEQHGTDILDTPFYAAMIVSKKIDAAFEKLGDPSKYMKLEKMLLLSVAETLEKSNLQLSEKTALIIATTKGSIDVLDPDISFPEERAYLPVLGKKIQSFFGFKQEPIVVSNACVSGILAVAVAKRLIQNNIHENAVVVAGDLVSKFTVTGFNTFQALSDGPCKPYSKFRNGISIGEAAASVVVSSEKKKNTFVQVIGDGSCNDANHISGPSRTGEGLLKSVQSAMREAEVSTNDIDLISAHGTATIYNDEMEAIAFNRAQLQDVPLHSLKGYYGHTLGAAGLLEAIIGFEAMNQNKLFTSLGYDESGTSKPLNIIQKTEKKTVNTFLKTASGFGGSNAAVLFKKVSCEH